MANKIFRGDYLVTQDVWTATVGGTVEAGDLFLTTINGKTVSVPASSTSTSTTATDIQSYVAASTIPEFQEATWENSGSTVIATGPDSGEPLTITVSTTESNGGAADAQTYAIVHTTTATNPNDWNQAANWSSSGVPGSDTIYLQASSSSVLNGLDQSAVTPAALHILASYTGDVGRPAVNPNGGYYEYRNTYLTFSSCAILNIGYGEGAGSRLIKINTGTAAGSVINVYATGSRKEDGVPSFLWKGAHASNSMVVHKGDVGIAFLPGETATLPVLTVGWTTNQASDATVYCGSGATLTTVTQTGGILTTNSAVTTLTVQGGVYYNYSGTHTTVTIEGGKVVWMGAATITSLSIDTDGEFDADSSDGNFVVVSPIVMKSGSTLRNRKQRINNGVPLAITLDGCGLKDVTLDVGDDVDLAINSTQGLRGLVTNGQIVCGFVPLDLQTQRSGDYINMTNYGHCTIIFYKGTGTDGDDPIITLQQATDTSGTGVKALNFSDLNDAAVYTKQAGDVQTVASFTRVTALTGGIHTFTANTYTNTDGHQQAFWVVEIDRDDLDLTNSFTCLRVTLNDTGTNAQLGSVMYILTYPLSSSLPSAL